MIYGSVCSGIEAATVAWHPLGWKAAWFSEIEPFPCRVLKHHYPDIPNLGDMLKIEQSEIFQQSTIDLVVGGTPCQSFSTAGLRGGLADARGNLALEFCRILAIKRPRWFVWENVPGVFSVDGGHAFRSILRGFSECGYSFSWRVLDAQFFGVPQRRRRVFVVGHLGNDWRPSAAVLFEPESLRGDSPEGRKPGQGITGTIGRRTSGRSIGVEKATGGMLVIESSSHWTMATGQPNAEILEDRAPTLNCNYERPIVFSINTQVGLRAHREGDGTGLGIGKDGDPAFTLQKGHHHAIVWSIMPQNSCKDYKAREVQVTQPITTNQGISNNDGDVIQTYNTVRRLTPLECERLQGFPDGYTNIPGASDSPRYEALGNSMARPVMYWIGRRINEFENRQSKHFEH